MIKEVSFTIKYKERLQNHTFLYYGFSLVTINSV